MSLDKSRIGFSLLALAAVVGVSGCATSIDSGSTALPRNSDSVSATASTAQAPAVYSQTIRITPEDVARARAAGTDLSPHIFRGAKIAHKTEKIVDKGGTITAPVIGGFKGSFTYPANNAPSGETISLETSTTDAFGAPQPSSGTPIWYLQAQLSGNGSINFQSGNGSAMMTQKSLSPSKTYSVWGFTPIFGNQPIFVIEAGSPKGHTLSFSSPLNGATIPEGIVVYIELVQN